MSWIYSTQISCSIVNMLKLCKLCWIYSFFYVFYPMKNKTTKIFSLQDNGIQTLKKNWENRTLKHDCSHHKLSVDYKWFVIMLENYAVISAETTTVLITLLCLFLIWILDIILEESPYQLERTSWFLPGKHHQQNIESPKAASL